LDKQLIDNFIINSLKEDVGDGDHTSLATIPAETTGKAKLLVKDNGILAGVELAAEIFHIVDPQLKLSVYRTMVRTLNMAILLLRLKETPAIY
jgi:nicotinate-nucleotide pyrophosphorylase (carboxylating)